VRLFMANEPTWRLIGLHAVRAPVWIRPLQLLGGLVLSALVARRAGWIAVLVIALAWRVTSDPYAWPYYVMGPLLGAALWDCTRRGSRWWSWLPWTTLSTVVAELLVERELPHAAPAVRLAWFVALTACVVVTCVKRGAPPPPTAPCPDRPQRPAGAAFAPPVSVSLS
jgi:hypothetical protein